jgi:hypothetical protein
MIPLLIVFCVALALVAGGLLFKIGKLRDAVEAANRESERLREYYESETARVYAEAQKSVAEAQKLVDQQVAEIKEESERVRVHYEAEARKHRQEADALVAQTLKDSESLQKYVGVKDAEAEAQRQLLEAIKVADNLRAQAQTLLEHSEAAAQEQRSNAEEAADETREQANARLDQAIRDAGRIVAEAEKRAQQIGGDAYKALREKELLEHAAEAIRNVIEGYGDRYVVPPHSVLDDFAEKFGYDEAGKALKSAREQSRRMVEQGQAASCDYVEAGRRQTAIQFVIVAFNGYVDSILSRVREDNYGTVEQKIKDAYSLVNHNGSAFRDARILPAYLDARLTELKWAVKLQELAARLRDEQRALREEMRDRELAEQEREAAEREAAKMVELKENALKEAEQEIARKIATATGEQKKQFEIELEKLRKDLAEATQKKLSIAQQTSVGHIYIISNEGSFGPGVYKIGLTRRDPEVRVDELYDASVPFGFDIHGVIKTQNAPALEYKLHRSFLGARLNKKNFHKEFFKVDLKEIREQIEKLAQSLDLTDAPQWRETEAGRAAEWQESRNIDNDPAAKENWLKRQQAVADEKWIKHEKRLAKRLQREALRQAGGVGNGSATVNANGNGGGVPAGPASSSGPAALAPAAS